MAVHHIPEGYHAVIPYLIVNDGNAALEFYKKALGATEVMRFPAPGGRIGHAEIKIGDAHVMLADEAPDMGCRSPQSIGGSPVSIMIYVPDADAVASSAVAAGAKLMRPVEDKFYGDRAGTIEDPFGHTWHIATHREDVSEEEMKARMAKLTGA